MRERGRERERERERERKRDRQKELERERERERLMPECQHLQMKLKPLKGVEAPHIRTTPHITSGLCARERERERERERAREQARGGKGRRGERERVGGERVGRRSGGGGERESSGVAPVDERLQVASTCNSSVTLSMP